MSIPTKCKYCDFLDYEEDDDGEFRSYRPICSRLEGCIVEDKNE